MRLMVVEDNPANVLLMQRVARAGAHEVQTFAEAEAALAALDEHLPDLMFVDVQLSGRLNGLDMVRQMRARGLRVPVVALTAYAMVGDRERCIEAGCDHYLSKPLHVPTLLELIQQYTPSPSA